MIKKVILIDNDKEARHTLNCLLLDWCVGAHVCGEEDSVLGGFQLIRQLQPDIIFLDMTLRDGTAFDLLDLCGTYRFKVILTTESNEFAVKAFRYHVSDYLLKPIHRSDFVNAMERLIHTETKISFAESIHKLRLSSQNGIFFVQLNDIMHIRSEGNYTTFFLRDKERYLVTRPMKSFEGELPDQQFFKLHQSHIINLHCLKSVLYESGGMVVLEDGSKIPISRRRKEAFYSRIS